MEHQSGPPTHTAIAKRPRVFRTQLTQSQDVLCREEARTKEVAACARAWERRGRCDLNEAEEAGRREGGHDESIR